MCFFHSIVGIIEVDLNLNFHGFEIWLFGYLGLPGISVLLELDWTSGFIEGGGRLLKTWHWPDRVALEVFSRLRLHGDRVVLFLGSKPGHYRYYTIEK